MGKIRFANTWWYLKQNGALVQEALQPELATSNASVCVWSSQQGHGVGVEVWINYSSLESLSPGAASARHSLDIKSWIDSPGRYTRDPGLAHPFWLIATHKS